MVSLRIARKIQTLIYSNVVLRSCGKPITPSQPLHLNILARGFRFLRLLEDSAGGRAVEVFLAALFAEGRWDVAEHHDPASSEVEGDRYLAGLHLIASACWASHVRHLRFRNPSIQRLLPMRRGFARVRRLTEELRTNDTHGFRRGLLTDAAPRLERASQRRTQWQAGCIPRSVTVSASSARYPCAVRPPYASGLRSRYHCQTFRTSAIMSRSRSATTTSSLSREAMVMIWPRGLAK